MKKKTAFIIGVSGQDGSYLAHLLLKKKYFVYGFTRNNSERNLINLKKLNIIKKIKIIQYYNVRIIKNKILKIKPSEIYFLSGQSSVKFSFTEPIITYKANTLFVTELLEFLRLKKIKSSFYNACSTDCFGNKIKKRFSEKDEFNPVSPYGRSKSYSYWIVKYYRENFNLNCCNGVLSNHESPLRKKFFVVSKIIHYVKNFNGKKKLKLGDINIRREWGWAPDYVRAIYKIANKKKKDDFLVSTGVDHSLKDLIKIVFKIKKIKIKNLKIFQEEYLRPNEIKFIRCNINKIKNKLKWKPRVSLHLMLEKLLKNEYY